MPPRNGSLLFSIEQWELIRRLRNSGLTKEHISQAFDDLNKIEQELGSMYNLPASHMQNSINSNNTGNTFNGNDASTKFASSQLINNMQIFQMAKNLSSMTQNNSRNGNSSSSNGNNSNTNSNHQNSNNGINFSSLTTNGNSFNNNVKHESSSSKNENSSNDLANNKDNNSHNSSNTSSSNINHSQNSNGQNSTAAATIVNNHFSSLMEPEQEAKLIDEFKLKGEVVIHGEISFFVYKHDLKQSQIARMAGVNQAYVSKFLRGEFFDLSENGKSLIYKWYLRFVKNSAIFHSAHNISVNPNIANNNNNTNGSLHQLNNSHEKLIKNNNNAENGSSNYSSFNNVTNSISYDTPKRSRFSFKPDHLVILERAFLENPYPDQKRREELSRQCNEAKPCSERVTEQIITHWFQNKRKITRKINTDDHSSISPRDLLNEEYRKNNILNEEYRSNEDNNSLNNEYRNNNDSNISSNNANQNNNDYQNESLIDYQDYIEDDSDFKTMLLDRQNEESSPPLNNSNRKKSTDSIDH